jgi:hypothetical protein
MTTATEGIFSPIRIGTMSLGPYEVRPGRPPPRSAATAPERGRRRGARSPPRSAATAPERGHRPASRATTGANASMERCATLM